MTSTGQRSSSVNRLARPASASWQSWICLLPSPTISEVRTSAAPGSRTRTAVSAAALAAPYGKIGLGGSSSAYGSGRPACTASLDTCTSRAPASAAAYATWAAPSAVTAQSPYR